MCYVGSWAVGHDPKMCLVSAKADPRCRALAAAAGCANGYARNMTTTCDRNGACDFTCAKPTGTSQADGCANVSKGARAPFSGVWNSADARQQDVAVAAGAVADRAGTLCGCVAFSPGYTLPAGGGFVSTADSAHVYTKGGTAMRARGTFCRSKPGCALLRKGTRVPFDGIMTSYNGLTKGAPVKLGAAAASAGFVCRDHEPLACRENWPVLRLFPPHAPSSHAQGSSGVVATVPLVWRGHTKRTTARSGPGPDLAMWLE